MRTSSSASQLSVASQNSLREELHHASISTIMKELRLSATPQGGVTRTVFCAALRLAFASDENMAAESTLAFLFDAVAWAAHEETRSEAEGISMRAVVSMLGSLCVADHEAVTTEVFSAYAVDATKCELRQDAMMNFLRIVMGVALALTENVAARVGHRVHAATAANRYAETAFNAMDKDSSHTIDREEFMTWLTQLDYAKSDGTSADEKTAPLAQSIFKGDGGGAFASMIKSHTNGDSDAAEKEAVKELKSPKIEATARRIIVDTDDIAMAIAVSECRSELRAAEREVARLEDANAHNEAHSAQHIVAFKELSEQIKVEADGKHHAQMEALREKIEILQTASAEQIREISEAHTSEAALREQGHADVMDGHKSQHARALESLLQKDAAHAETKEAHAQVQRDLELEMEGAKKHAEVLAAATAKEQGLTAQLEAIQSALAKEQSVHLAAREAINDHKDQHALALESLAQKDTAHAETKEAHAETMTAHLEQLGALRLDHDEERSAALVAQAALEVESERVASLEMVVSHRDAAMARTAEAHAKTIESHSENQLEALAQAFAIHNKVLQSHQDEVASEQEVAQAETMRVAAKAAKAHEEKHNELLIAQAALFTENERAASLETKISAHEATMSKLVETHAVKLDEHNEQHLDALAMILADHDNEMESHRTQAVSEQEAASAEKQRLVAESEAALKHAVDTTRDDLEAAHDAALHAMRTSHEADIAEVHGKVEAAHAAHAETHAAHAAVVEAHAQEHKKVREMAQSFIRKSTAESAEREEKMFARHREELKETRATCSVKIVALEEKIWKFELGQAAVLEEAAQANRVEKKALREVRSLVGCLCFFPLVRSNNTP